MWRPHPRRAVQPRSRTRPAAMPVTRRCGGQRGAARKCERQEARSLQCAKPRDPRARPHPESRRRPREGADGGHELARTRRSAPRRDRRGGRVALHAAAGKGRACARPRIGRARRRGRAQAGRGGATAHRECPARTGDQHVTWRIALVLSGSRLSASIACAVGRMSRSTLRCSASRFTSSMTGRPP